MSKNAKRISSVLLTILLIAGLIVLLSSLVVTKENEYTLVKQFGKIQRVHQNSGLSFKVPFVETVDKLPKQIQFYDLPKSDVITKDKKTMVVDSYVLWRITEPIIFAQSLNSSTAAEGRIDSIVYNSIKNVIGSLEQSEVVSGRDGELSKAFMDNIGDTMKSYGVELISVETKHLDLPSNNKQAVYNRMISERTQIAATYTAEGESESQIIQNSTDREVAISISNAETQAARITAEGEAEYMRILSNAYSDPARGDFYTFIRSLDAARASLSGKDKTLILSADSPIAQIFNQVE